MADQTSKAPSSAKQEPDKKRRVIPGNLTYTTTPGKLKTALQNLIAAERPETFNKAFIETYLGVSGGSAAPIPNILKRADFLGGDGRPTEWYAKFQTDGGRPEAALHGVKKGFGEIFKKNTFAHSLPEEKVKEIILEITGLTKNDPILGQIYGTFDAFRSFIPNNYVSGKSDSEKGVDQDPRDVIDMDERRPGSLGISYHINIVLPETKDIAVFNAIFQSLKNNLL